MAKITARQRRHRVAGIAVGLALLCLILSPNNPAWDSPMYWAAWGFAILANVFVLYTPRRKHQ